MKNAVIWVLFAASGLIWLAAIFYILKGWSEYKKKDINDKMLKEPHPRETQKERPKDIREETQEVEIPIPEYPHPESERPVPFDKDAFYREFGRSNVVEFPAEYIDKENVRSITGERISMVEFAEGCYRQIGFRCSTSLIPAAKELGMPKISIFDLAFDHYSRTDEAFINLFGQLKDKFAEDIEAIKDHPDMTPAARKSLVGIYEPLPPLVAWSDRELFLVAVVSAYEDLPGSQMNFLKGLVIEKKIFKARIFRVTQREKR